MRTVLVPRTLHAKCGSRPECRSAGCVSGAGPHTRGEALAGTPGHSVGRSTCQGQGLGPGTGNRMVIVTPSAGACRTGGGTNLGNSLSFSGTTYFPDASAR